MLVSIGRFSILAVYCAGALLFSRALTGSSRPWIAVVGTFDWLVVNLANRVVDVEEDSANAIPHTSEAKKFGKRIYMALAIALAVSFVVHFGAPMFYARLGGHMLGAVYNFRLIPWRGDWVRLKSIYVVKNVASCGGFLTTLFLYPLASFPLADGVDSVMVLDLLGFFIPLEICFEIVYDIRDLAGDKASGIDTIPVRHGVAKAVHVCFGLDFTAFLIIFGFGAVGAVPWWGFAFPFLVGIMIHVACILCIRNRGFLVPDVVLLNWGFAAAQLLHLALLTFTKLPDTITGMGTPR